MEVLNQFRYKTARDIIMSFLSLKMLVGPDTGIQQPSGPSIILNMTFLALNFYSQRNKKPKRNVFAGKKM